MPGGIEPGKEQIFRIFRQSMRVGVLLLAPALIGWLTGLPFIFPSLGPSAFSLVINGEGEATGRRVIGGHLIGVLCGFSAYHLMAHGVNLAALPSALSLPLLRLAASGVISVVLTTAAMQAIKAQHPPACATTLIVSLGILATLRDAMFIMLAVMLMFASYRLLPPVPRAGGSRSVGDDH